MRHARGGKSPLPMAIPACEYGLRLRRAMDAAYVDPLTDREPS